MTYSPPNNPTSGISIVGLLLGVLKETSTDGRYTNYRIGVATQSRPDKFGQVSQVTNEIELTESQFQRLSVSINSNQLKPVRIWVDISHRAGEKNGRVWEILNLNMRSDSEIEYLNHSVLTPNTQNYSNDVPTLSPIDSKIPDGIKKA